MPWASRPVAATTGSAPRCSASNGASSIRARTAGRSRRIRRLEFLPPGLHHAASAQSGVAWLLPIQVQRNFGAFDAGFDIGRTLASSGDGWFGGVDVGHKVSEWVELMAELHDETTDGDGHELVFDVGTRAKLSEHLTLLASLGTDVENTSGPRNEWVSYLGLQLHL